jgi:V/A-type H+-transporting ATPase subunit E
MTTATDHPAVTTGVQELIDKIRDEGVRTARDQAKQILAEARAEAAATKAKATAEAKAMVESARAQVATEKAAGAEAIRNAARDSLLQLRDQVRKAFEVHVRRLVSREAQDTGFIRSLVLVLAGEAAEKHLKDQDAVIFVSRAAASATEGQPESPEVQAKIQNAVLGATGQMLREGIQLLPDDHLKGGAKARLVDRDLEIDMSDEALARLLVGNLLPRYRTIVESQEGAKTP